MRIKEVNIANFGRLHDFKISFNPGLNEFNERNGWGKSTLCAFIKVMLYGFEGDGKRDELSSERRRYKPWQGGTYGGSMTIETAGTAYVITRTFGTKVAEDVFELRTASDNLVSDAFSERIGEELFKINAESFARTVFVRQDDCSDSHVTDDINAKLGNITDVIDLNRYSRISDSIKDELNSLSATRKTGEIYKLKESRTELESRLRLKPETEQTANAIKARIVDTRGLLDENLEKLAKSEALFEKAAGIEAVRADRRNYEELLKDCEDKRQAYEQAASRRPYDGNLPSEDEITDLNFHINELSTLRSDMASVSLNDQEKEKLDEYRRGYGFDSISGEAIDDAQNAYIAAFSRDQELANLETGLSDLEFSLDEASDRKKKLKILTVTEIVTMIAGIALAVLNLTVFPGLKAFLYSGAVLFLVSLVLFIINIASAAGISREAEVKRYECDRLRGEIDKIRAHMDSAEELVAGILKQSGILFNPDTAVADLRMLYSYRHEYETLVRKEETLKSCDKSADIEKIKAIIDAMFAGFGAHPSESEYRSVLYQIDRYREEMARLTGLMNDAKERMDRFVSTHDMDKIKSTETDKDLPPADEIRSETQRLKAEEERLKAALSEDIRQLKMKEERLAEFDETADSLDAVRESIESKSERVNVLQDVSSFLNKAKENLTSRYMEPLRKGFAKYYGMVCPGEDNPYRLDANIDLTVEESGVQHSVAFLSNGLKDLTGLCMRLALADAMYPEEKPMLVLDDTFVNYDDINFKGAKELIDRVKDEYQIIYLTCSEGRGV